MSHSGKDWTNQVDELYGSMAIAFVQLVAHTSQIFEERERFKDDPDHIFNRPEGGDVLATVILTAATEQQKIKEAALHGAESQDTGRSDPEVAGALASMPKDSIMNPMVFQEIIEVAQELKEEAEQRKKKEQLGSVAASTASDRSETADQLPEKDLDVAPPVIDEIPVVDEKIEQIPKPPPAEYEDFFTFPLHVPPPPLPQVLLCSICGEEADGRCEGGPDSCGILVCGSCGDQRLMKYPSHAPPEDRNELEEMFWGFNKSSRRRASPDSKRVYTAEELIARYWIEDFSKEEIRDYWNEEMTPYKEKEVETGHIIRKEHLAFHAKPSTGTWMNWARPVKPSLEPEVDEPLNDGEDSISNLELGSATTPKRAATVPVQFSVGEEADDSKTFPKTQDLDGEVPNLAFSDGSNTDEDSSGTSSSDNEIIHATTLDVVVQLCQLVNAERCFGCKREFTSTALYMCEACRELDERYCEDCGFIDRHHCIRTGKMQEPSGSIATSWGEDDLVWGPQCRRCRGYRHGDRQCPVIDARKDEEFRKRFDKNNRRCTSCDGWGHEAKHHEDRENRIERKRLKHVQKLTKGQTLQKTIARMSSKVQSKECKEECAAHHVDRKNTGSRIVRAKYCSHRNKGRCVPKQRTSSGHNSKEWVHSRKKVMNNYHNKKNFNHKRNLNQKPSRKETPSRWWVGRVRKLGC